MLVNALVRLRLVNRMNLGVRRMFQSMLMEGKAPPTLAEQGESVLVRFRKQPISAPFRLFVTDEGKAGRVLSVEHLLVLHHLLGHPELDTAAAALLCQRTDPEARELLNDLETGLGYLERGGTGRGTYWALRPDLHQRLAGSGHPERTKPLPSSTNPRVTSGQSLRFSLECPRRALGLAAATPSKKVLVRS